MILCAAPHAQYRRHRAAIDAAVARVLDGGQYMLGEEVQQFERAFAAYCDTEEAVGVNSGTDALLLTFKALGVGPGDEIITVSHTALATVAAVLACGATPVLVDVDETYWTMDPAQVERAVTPKTKAIVPVHLYGQAADIDALARIARDHNVPLIEDCAQATGGRYAGRRLGSFGHAACFSFYPTKNLGAIGDGGAIVTGDSALAARLRRLRQYGWDDYRTTAEPGLNSRLDVVQAAILGAKLPFLDEDNDRRRAIAARYDAALRESGLGLPAARDNSDHVYHLYVLTTADRDGIRDALAARGVQAGVHYPVPAHRHGGYKDRVRIPIGDLPVTNTLAATVLSLPMYPELTDAEVDQVLAAMTGSARIPA